MSGGSHADTGVPDARGGEQLSGGSVARNVIVIPGDDHQPIC